MSPKTRKPPRPAERDYSHRSLLDKLGVKPEHRLAVIGLADEDFLSQLAARAAGVSRDHPTSDSDLIFYAAEDKKNLQRLNSFVAFLKRNGGIWVIYPKGQQRIREMDVIAAGKAAGLVDNKVVRFSDTHTALRLVIPVAQR